MAKKIQDPSLGMAANENVEAVFDAKKMLQKNADDKTKIRYNDRLRVEIVKETKYYNVGKVINPHKVKGQALIDQGIAKKYVEKD